MKIYKNKNNESFECEAQGFIQAIQPINFVLYFIIRSIQPYFDQKKCYR